MRKIGKQSRLGMLTAYYFLRSKGKFGKRRRTRTARRAFEEAMRNAPDCAMAIDCGANVGDVAQQLLGAGLQVHAFEPDPVAAERLFKRIGHHPALTFHQSAVGIDPGSQTLYRRKEFDQNPQRWTMSSSLLRRKVCNDANSVVVDVIDFLSYLRQLEGRVAILKMDIEGAEVEILEQLIETGLHEKIDLIFAETHERINLSCALRIARIRALIHANDFRHFNLDHN